VRNSTLQNLTNGDGLFARRFIPALSMVAIYAGYFIDTNATMTHENMTIDEQGPMLSFLKDLRRKNWGVG
jgi:hypothetical protein